MVTIVWQLMMGVSLAACAGLRAFLPLLVVGLAGRAGLVELGSRFEWLASTPVLVGLGVAVLLEVGADKIPLLDHLLDSVATFVRPAAGVLVAAAPLTSLDPFTSIVAAIVLGGGVAAGVHASKASLRLASTGASCGAANPVVSAVEDGISFFGSVVALIAPFATFVLVLGALYLLFRLGRSLRRRSSMDDSAGARRRPA